MTWEEIFASPIYKVDTFSVQHPVGASLFDVCIASEDEFRTIEPRRNCLNSKLVSVGQTLKDSYLVAECIEYGPWHYVSVPATIEYCTEWGPYPLDKKKQSSATAPCLEYGEPHPIATTQELVVQRSMKSDVFAFRKIYTVPQCEEVEPVGHKKDWN